MTDKDTTGPDEPGSESSGFMSALVTEHFVLQSVASSTIGESGSRASIYLAALSSALVAIGFASSTPSLFAVLAYTVFPTVFILGCFTLVRLVDTSIANIVAQRRIELIRRYYASLHPAGPTYFSADGDSTVGTLGVRYNALSVFFTMASMIAIVNSVLGGACFALVASGVFSLSIGGAVVIGIFAGAVILVLSLWYQVRRFRPTQQDAFSSANSSTA